MFVKTRFTDEKQDAYSGQSRVAGRLDLLAATIHQPITTSHTRRHGTNEMAEVTEDDEDLLLVKASAGLLDDLQEHLPKLLWKPSATGQSTVSHHGGVHSRVRHKDLSYVVNLVRSTFDD